MSFCRITGRSRGLPKPNYFPLLQPISPADAKRCCRITGKSYGLPTHHYIPVLLTANSSKTKCKITNVSGDLGPHHYQPEINYGNRKHEILPDYRYIFPILDGTTDAQKTFREMLDSKKVLDDKRYVYTVSERRCSLVFPAKLEAAVRDGDVRDVMLAKDSDTILIKMKQGRQVSMDFADYISDGDLFEGEGPSTEVLKLREIEETEAKKKKRKRSAALSNMKKIFETKEKLAEVEELEEEKFKMQHTKKAKIDQRKKIKAPTNIHTFQSFDFHHNHAASNISLFKNDWRDQKYPIKESWDWDEFEKEVKNSSCKSKISKLPTPMRINPITAEAENIEVNKHVANISLQLECVACVSPLSPSKIYPDPEILQALKNLTENQLNETLETNIKKLNVDQLEELPSLETVSNIAANIKKGHKARKNNISGLSLDIDKAKTFIPGQHLVTPNGNLFIPGQTVSTPAGLSFVPGMTVNTPAGPALIPGHILTDESTDQLFFIAGQIATTPKGERFIKGQVLKSPEGTARFVEGETVNTEEGLKFVCGKMDENEVFVPGQTISTPEGFRFIPGQTIPENESETFIPGQSTDINGDWQFVPGQTIKENGCNTFVPGATILTPSGLKFVPGQVVDAASSSVFVPGITKETNEGFCFIPGVNVETIDGPKFLEGQIVSTEKGEAFVPGITKLNNSKFEFSVAKCAEDIIFHESAPPGLAIDSHLAALCEDSLYVFGHMVQTAKGIQFHPGALPLNAEGKIVPGRLVKNEYHETRFVPGMMFDGSFVPGQMVFTEKGEQFVPGQVVDTQDGPKFVPGQVVNTKGGPKFVPGQTIDTIDGPRFIPGQIIETKAGPTFIPGQVISTEEEGSRFVPGQVVDTEEGPRFVPGRVIETDDNKVTFIPGHIVETPDGLKFIAPDLTEGESGFEFSVQSFVVTPEELKLLKIKSHATNSCSKGELSIDAKMLRQLSEAGMTIGRQVPTDLPSIEINSSENKEMLESFVTDYDLKDAVAMQLMSVISSIIEMSINLKNNINEGSVEREISSKKFKRKSTPSDVMSLDGSESALQQENVKNSIAAAVLAALVTSEQYSEDKNNNNSCKEKYRSILKSINTVIGKSIDESFVSSMYNILQTEEEKEILCQQIMAHSTIAKVELLKLAMDNCCNQNIQNDDIIEKFSDFFSSENAVLGQAFKNITKNDPDLLKNILMHISEAISFINDEHHATETLQKAVVAAIQETSSQNLTNMLEEGKLDDIKELFEQSLGLAKSLGMDDVVVSLKNILNDNDSLQNVKNDGICMTVLKRLTIMRQLAENDPSLYAALRKLEKDPFVARTDPKLRELVRESAALMIVPEDSLLMTSDDIPLKLLQSENSLAMEDFLIRRRKHYGTLLIIKKGLQAVVPREDSRAVLTGQVAYTVLDENGIRHFEPLHVFSALQLNQPIADQFSMYSCPVTEDSNVEYESLSDFDTISASQRITRLGWLRRNRGVYLDRENTSSRMSGQDYASFKRYSSLSSLSFRSDSLSRSPSKVDDVLVATSDYTATSDDEVSLKAGDIVEVLDTKPATSAKYRGRVYCYDNHYFQQYGKSLNYIFSLPTYKMYYV